MYVMNTAKYFRQNCSGVQLEFLITMHFAQKKTPLI